MLGFRKNFLFLCRKDVHCVVVCGNGSQLKLKVLHSTVDCTRQQARLVDDIFLSVKGDYNCLELELCDLNLTLFM
jgi:hypothetical protein